MAMDPRTHPRGAAPDFSMDGLPPNPNPNRITPAMWWLACMRLRLEPLSENGGIYANKAGYHNAGENLLGHEPGGAGKATTDHSIRWEADRTGPWWLEFSAAHDWTFTRAHSGNYTEIIKYTTRLMNAMKNPNDPRPDDVYAYVIGQADWDLTVEGYNERTNEDETGDKSHLWHRHDSFRRNIVGLFLKMWQALTIDMGWSVADWRKSIGEDPVAFDAAEQQFIKDQSKLSTATDGGGGLLSPVGSGVWGHGWPRRPGDQRSSGWVNMQGMQVDLDTMAEEIDDVKDNTAVAALHSGNAAAAVSFLTDDFPNDGNPEDDPIVKRLRYVLANQTPPQQA